MDVPFWEAEVKRLEQELASAREALDAALIATFPFAVGDVVEAQFKRGGVWEPVLIREIQPQFGPWFVVTRHPTKGRRSDHSTGRLHKKTLDQIRALHGDKNEAPG